jgi:hypothetical protein
MLSVRDEAGNPNGRQMNNAPLIYVLSLNISKPGYVKVYA